MEGSQGDASSAAICADASDTKFVKTPGVTAAGGASHFCTVPLGALPDSRPSPFLPALPFQLNRHFGNLGKGQGGSQEGGMWWKIVLCHFQTKPIFKNKGGGLTGLIHQSSHRLIGQKPGDATVLCPDWRFPRSGKNGAPRG